MTLLHLILAAGLAWGGLEALHRILPKSKRAGFLSKPGRDLLSARGWARCSRCEGPFVLGKRCLWCEPKGGR